MWPLFAALFELDLEPYASLLELDLEAFCSPLPESCLDFERFLQLLLGSTISIAASSYLRARYFSIDLWAFLSSSRSLVLWEYTDSISIFKEILETLSSNLTVLWVFGFGFCST